jgi:UDP-N-acetyl-D-glucosamine dehydrogenase
MEAVPLEDAFSQGFECAVITTDHQAFDYKEIVRRSPLVVDTRNVLKGCKEPHIFRL